MVQILFILKAKSNYSNHLGFPTFFLLTFLLKLILDADFYNFKLILGWIYVYARQSLKWSRVWQMLIFRIRQSNKMYMVVTKSQHLYKNHKQSTLTITQSLFPGTVVIQIKQIMYKTVLSIYLLWTTKPSLADHDWMVSRKK